MSAESGYLLVEAVFTLAISAISGAALFILIRTATQLSLQLERAAQTDQTRLECRSSARFYECKQGEKLLITLK